MKTAVFRNDKVIVSSKGQVVIPKSFRVAFGIHIGTELIFEAHNNTVMTLKPVRRNIEMCFGRCKSESQPVLSVDAMDNAIMQAVLLNDEASKNDDKY